jgi:hypothetical protein
MTTENFHDDMLKEVASLKHSSIAISSQFQIFRNFKLRQLEENIKIWDLLQRLEKRIERIEMSMSILK